MKGIFCSMTIYHIPFCDLTVKCILCRPHLALHRKKKYFEQFQTYLTFSQECAKHHFLLSNIVPPFGLRFTLQEEQGLCQYPQTYVASYHFNRSMNLWRKHNAAPIPQRI